MQLRNGYFTVTSVDKIDRDPSLTTVCSSFYGTTISVFQKATERLEKMKIDIKFDYGEE